MTYELAYQQREEGDAYKQKQAETVYATYAPPKFELPPGGAYQKHKRTLSTPHFCQVQNVVLPRGFNDFSVLLTFLTDPS